MHALSRLPSEAAGPRFALIIPTLNAGGDLPALLPALAAQTRQPDRFVVVDSDSEDGTRERFRAAGAEVQRINRATFDHGGTRTRALECIGDVDFAIYMTQDAYPAAPDAFEKLLRPFDDEAVAVTYGRQLPKAGATPAEAFARHFNYPSTSEVRSLDDARVRGFRACFCSNSFAAYRLRDLRAVGAFPSSVISGEDTLATAALIAAGRSSAYAADALVYHSHRYTPGEEFSRYFDIGVMHAGASGMLQTFGEPTGEGVKYLLGELRYLLSHHPLGIPECLLRTACKYTGYKLGRRHRLLPHRLKRAISLNSGYWREIVGPADGDAGLRPPQ